MNSVVRSPMGAKACVVLIGLLFAMSGCGGRRGDIPTASAQFNVQPDQLFIENRDYRLGPSDMVTVTVYRAPEVSGDFRIDTTGNIMMPLLGQVPAQGMTSTEFAEALRKRLNGRYYLNPDVSVSIKEAVNQRVTIDGSVNSPGLYALPGRTTLMQAVALAHGASGGANLHRVVVFRQINGQRMAAVFDLRAIRESLTEDPLIYASDIIIVDGNETRQAWRDIISTIPIVALFRPFLL